MLLTPILNSFIQTTEKKNGIISIISLLFFIAIIPTYLKNDLFNVKTGYSTLWLAIMYLLGGIVSKYNIGKLISKCHCIILFSLLVLSTWLNKLLDIIPFDLVKYTSPTIILSALSLLLLFSNLSLLNKRMIQITLFLSSSSFAVYLIHDNPIFRRYIFGNLTKPFINDSILLVIFKILGIALSIYLISSLIDKLRQIFMKIIRIDNHLKNLEQSILKFRT